MIANDVTQAIFAYHEPSGRYHINNKEVKMSAKPWLEHYDQGVPKTLKPYPEITLIETLREIVSIKPEFPLLLFKGAPMVAMDLDQLSDAMGAALIAKGVKKGDRVALILPNSPQSFIGLFGIWKAGGIAVPINPLYTEGEMEFALKECGATVAMVLSPFYYKVKSIQGHTDVGLVVATNIKEYLPPVLRLLFTLVKEKKEGYRITLQTGDMWLSALLDQFISAQKPDVQVKPEDPAIFLFSGGTTGVPKCAIGSHQGLVMSGMQINSWFRLNASEWQGSIMQNMPPFHVYGLAGVMPTGLVGHYTLVLVPNPRDMKDLVETIHKVKPTFLPGVPSLFIALINQPDVQSGKVSLKSIKNCISGAAPLMNETKQRFEELTGGNIVEGYAMTESMMGTVISPIGGTYKPGSTGMPVTDVEIRIVDAETGQEEMPAGQVGEITMRCPQLMLGYYHHPTETANSIQDGWLFTGDLGYMDEDGYLFIVDRKKDVIKPGGFQVWPREVEEVIASHPAVAEVGVAGIADAYSGESVKAWVVLREGKQVTDEELRQFCHTKLVGYKVPKQIEFRDSLPKSLIGKVLRRELVR
ncbi:MAG: AMP-dependent synthetase, partial [Chloroflexi bacterium RBG_13_50_21]